MDTADPPALIWKTQPLASYQPVDGVARCMIETNGTSALTYPSTAGLAAVLVHRLRQLITSRLDTTPDSLCSVAVAVAIPEGIYLALSVLAVHALGEPHDNVSVVLLPLDPNDAETRLRHQMETARPLVILTAADCDYERLQSIVENLSTNSLETESMLFRPKKLHVVDVRPLFDCDDQLLDRVSLWGRPNGPVARWILDAEATLFGTCTPTCNTNRISHVVFTSGTTGVPKGCVSSASALKHYLSAKNAAHAIDTTSRILLASSVSFDPCFSDILATLLAGAVLILPTRQELVGDLGSVLDAHSVTHCLCTPSLWGSLSVQPAKLPSLRVVALGGEPIPRAIRRTWAASGRVRLFATYGVTEACVYQTMGEVTETKNTAPGQDVGRPFDGLSVSIVEESNCSSLTSVGTDRVGEVVLSGNQLDEFSGYLIQSSPKFVAQDGCYYYRTGDRGTVNVDGVLTILGRINGEDGMVKINGVRVELGEMEAAIVDEPNESGSVVMDCAVVVERGEESESLTSRNVKAYVVLSQECCTEMSIAAKVPTSGVLCTPGPLLTLLRKRCNKKARVCPAAFVVIPGVPLSPTGKRDRNGLPKTDHAVPLASLMGEARALLLKDHGRTGKVIASEIVEALNLLPAQQEMLTTAATFAMVGGDSLAATRIVRALYAQHHGIHNSRHLGGEYGVLEGPFAVVNLLTAANLGQYVDFLDQHGVCADVTTTGTNAASSPSVATGTIAANDADAHDLHDALVQATSLGHTQIALGVLGMGADPNFSAHKGRLGKTSGRMEQRRTFRTSPLHLACNMGDAALVDKLLQCRAKYNSPDASGMFPIHLVAARKGDTESDINQRIECMRLLLDAGAPMTMKDGNKETLIHTAARRGHTRLLRFVMEKWLEYSASNPRLKDSLDWKDRWYRTPVHWAVLNGHVETLAILLETGCSAHPPKLKAIKHSSVALETPVEICERLYASTEKGQQIMELLNRRDH